MTLLTDEVKRCIGMQSAAETACEPVERGAVRRYAQAIMDEDPIYREACEGNARYGGPVAPPLFPTQMFRRSFGTPDPVDAYALDPDFDGVTPTITQGLPEIEALKRLSMLNGGSEFEFFRYARHGDTVTRTSRYANIEEKTSGKGPMLFVTIETEYRNGSGELLARARRTLIWR